MFERFEERHGEELERLIAEIDECANNENAVAEKPEVKGDVELTDCYSYNARRYSKPWVAAVNNGEYDFNIGRFEGTASEGGSLVVTNPKINQLYAYGQKDHRRGNTRKEYCYWDGEKFVGCNWKKEIVNDGKIYSI